MPRTNSYIMINYYQNKLYSNKEYAIEILILYIYIIRRPTRLFSDSCRDWLKVQSHLYLKRTEVKVYFSMWVRLVDVRPKSQYIKGWDLINSNSNNQVSNHTLPLLSLVRSKSALELSKFSDNKTNEFLIDKTMLGESMRRAKLRNIFSCERLFHNCIVHLRHYSSFQNASWFNITFYLLHACSVYLRQCNADLPHLWKSTCYPPRSSAFILWKCNNCPYLLRTTYLNRFYL